MYKFIKFDLTIQIFFLLFSECKPGSDKFKLLFLQIIKKSKFDQNTENTDSVSTPVYLCFINFMLC